ncbi:MAG TPA: ACT domain-containing protein [Micromonosporaceae bacterium]|nr:ACT domain-containing protein [Micromonosporaceae bacterium]
MLLCRIIVRLPDRPGSLGRITTLLGRLGADIHQMLVVDRANDRATDEFIVALPGLVVYRQLADLLEEIDDVSVLGLWPVDHLAEDRPPAIRPRAEEIAAPVGAPAAEAITPPVVATG